MTVTEQFIYDYLGSVKLNYLRKPFQKMLNKNVPGQTFKKLKTEIKKSCTSSEFEQLLISYLEKYNITYTTKRYKYQDKTATKRQQEYRQRLKEQNIKTVKVQLDLVAYEKLQRVKKRKNKSYSELFSLWLTNYLKD